MISIKTSSAGRIKTRQATNCLNAGIFMPVGICFRDDKAVIHGRGYGVEIGNRRLITANTSPLHSDRRKPAVDVLIEAITVTLNDGFIKMSTEAVMPNIIILSKEIRQHSGLYNLKDLYKAAKGEKKHQPSNFLRLAQTRELIKELNSSDVRSLENGTDVCLSDENTADSRFLNKVAGRYGGTYVCKELVYAYAMWISPKFHLAVIRAFDQIQTEQPKPTTKGSLVVADPNQTITIVTTIEPGQPPKSQTYQGKVALMPCTALLEFDKRMSGAHRSHFMDMQNILTELHLHAITAKSSPENTTHLMELPA